MRVARNIQIKLDVPEDAHSVLDATFEQFRKAAQHVADTGWSDDSTAIEHTKNTLHEQTYADVREQTSLQASLVQSARNLAANTLGNCKDRILEDGKKTSKPEFRGSVVATTPGCVSRWARTSGAYHASASSGGTGAGVVGRSAGGDSDIGRRFSQRPD